MIGFLIEICFGIGMLVSALTYFVWAYDHVQAHPDRLAFGEFTSAGLLRGVLIVLGEGLAWGAFIVLTPFAFLGDFLAYHRRPGTHRPVLLVHGYLHNRGAWVAHGWRLRRAGWTQVYSINLWPIHADLDVFAQQVRDAVARILGETGASEVDLVCHSMGGLVARAYIQQYGGAEHVARFVTLSGPHHGTRLAPFGPARNTLAMSIGSEYLAGLEEEAEALRSVAVTAVYSVHDNIVIPASSAVLPEPAESHELAGVGHAGMLWSSRAWEHLRRALEREPDVDAEQVAEPDVDAEQVTEPAP